MRPRESGKVRNLPPLSRRPSQLDLTRTTAPRMLRAAELHFPRCSAPGRGGAWGEAAAGAREVRIPGRNCWSMNMERELRRESPGRLWGREPVWPARTKGLSSLASSLSVSLQS